jgi:hypothetical protein
MKTVKFTKNGHNYEMWYATVKTEVDPVSGLKISVLAKLKLDDIDVADYGVFQSGELALASYRAYSGHNSLYYIIYKDIGLTDEEIALLPDMTNEYESNN